MKIIKLITSGIRKPDRHFLVIVILVCASVFTISHAQTISGGILSIGADAVVTSNNDMMIQTGGTLNVQGTLILKKSLTNGNSTPNSLGSGLIELSGTTTQTVSGQNIFQNLRVNNTAGITVTGNTRVNGALNLKNGIVSIASSNLLLGPAATDSGGSVTAMVIATGTGEFRKEFSAPGSFTFLVGDTTGAAEYSPVAVNFTDGTFGTDNYLGVSLKNLPDPDPNIASGNYLNRYWTLNNYNITGTISCGLTFNFLDADVNVGGTKANLFCVETSSVLQTYNSVSGNQLTATVTGFSRFTGADAALQGNFKAYLQGPYDNITNHNMTNTLATTLPLGDRSVLTNFPSNQPYNIAPWSYTGTESVITLPANVVDWVLVELRQADIASHATNATVFARRAGFILKDGSIVDPDGTPMRFYHAAVTQSLFPVIRHRNHMAIMASTGVLKDGTGTYAYDYSSGSGKVYGGAFGMKQIDTSISPVRWGMIAADANADNHIWTSDYDVYGTTYFISSKYLPADFNLDAHVWTSDYDFYGQNFFITNPLPDF